MALPAVAAEHRAGCGPVLLRCWLCGSRYIISSTWRAHCSKPAPRCCNGQIGQTDRRTDRRTDGRTPYRYTTLTVPRSRYRAVGSETISRGHGGPVDGTATRRMLLKSELHHPANIVENMAVVAASFDGNTAAARLTSGLISVHWLRARERARFKTAVLMYKACTHGTESAGSCRRSAHCLPLITRSLLSSHAWWTRK